MQRYIASAVPVSALILALRSQTLPQVLWRFGCRLAGSILLPDPRQPPPFVCAQKAAKSAVIPPMCSRQAKLPVAISTPRFEGSDNPPAGRPQTFAPYRRAIFMGHSVRVLSTRARPADAGGCAAAGVSVQRRLPRPSHMRRVSLPPTDSAPSKNAAGIFCWVPGEKGVLRPLTPWSKDVAAGIRANGY